MTTLRITRLRDSDVVPELGIYSVAENDQWETFWHAESELHAIEQWLDAEMHTQEIEASNVDTIRITD